MVNNIFSTFDMEPNVLSKTTLCSVKKYGILSQLIIFWILPFKKVHSGYRHSWALDFANMTFPHNFK